MARELKKPSDYPLFYFRLKTQAEKVALERQLESALKSANKKFNEMQRAHTKGEVLRAALSEGLKLVRQGKLKIPD